MPRVLKLALAVALVWLFVPIYQTQAQQNEPSREPILRIETGMHTATVQRIGVDAENRFLVTGSPDKTVRVWELPSGRLLRIIRPPLGEGNEGKIFAVAISPDGNTIAAGGWTTPNGLNGSIYFFDRESGKLIRRLGPMPGSVVHLVYSADGRHLAVSFGGNDGVRVYQTNSWTVVGEDKDYQDQGYGADFDRSGRLVTTSYDGQIRLYGAPSGGALPLIAKVAPAEGKHPFAVRFSPDGTRVAVGFADVPKVTVLSARDLSPVLVPDTTGVDQSNLSQVAWSADGRTLYGAGQAQHSGSFYLRAWTDGGRGAFTDIPAAGNTIMHILPLRFGGVAYGSTEPSFGTADASGKRTMFNEATIANYTNLLENFLVAPDGAGIRFGYQSYGRSPARFSLIGRALETAPTAVDASWRAPVTEDANIKLTEWRHSYTPKLNGTALKISDNEISRTVAIAPDRNTFLFGSNFNLRLFDRNGVQKWETAVPEEAWTVNISADGRLALAAFADGTIRWHNMKDGKELLAFFPHPDRKRWVIWTPSGYYDASPGAEELIGWHVNNGKDQAADFFPVGQFRAAYYRPDVIAKILVTGDETVALRQANEDAGRRQQQLDLAKQLPPVVEIISPADGSEVAGREVTVRYRVRTSSGEPVTNVKALVNGRPLEGARLLVQNAAAADGAREISVTLPEGENTVSVIAENRYASSVPANVRLRSARPNVPANTSAGTASLLIKPKLYILAVGISKYGNEKYNLQFADKDARDFVATMQGQKGLLYRDTVVKTLTNEQATKDEVLDGLDWIRKETTSNDVAMVFFAGHGVNDQNNYYYFCPYNIDPERLLRTGVAFSDIKNTISAIAGKALFFVDTCHSGNSLGMGGRRGGLDINIVINELSSAENGAIVFSASTGSESSYERPEWNNGAFTKALIEGLNGGASLGNSGRITYAMLNVFISERVKELTKGQQHPTMISPNTIADFPIAMRKQ